MNRTYFTASIYLDGQAWSSSTSAAVNTLENALQVAFADATYYLGHHREAYAMIEERCAACYGEGEIVIRGPRSTKTKVCRECKGRKGAISVVQFPCIPHPNVRSIDNGAAEPLQRP